MRSIPRLGGVCSALFLVFSAASAHADTGFMLETDPSTFVLKGFALHARVVPGRGHFAIGAGAYALDFPKVLVDLNPSNRNDGWNVRLRFGGALFADYYFEPDAKAWFVGVELAAQSYRYTNDATPGAAASAVDVVVMPRGGYQWQPFDAGFYVMPWLGLGYAAQVSGDRTVGEKTYALSHFVPYAAVHVGWTF